MTFDPKEQATRRVRARLSQQAVGDEFPTPISDTAIGRYENEGKPLPLRYTPEDYETALAKALLKKRGAA